MRLLIEILILLSSLKCIASQIEQSSTPVTIQAGLPTVPVQSYLKPITYRKNANLRTADKKFEYYKNLKNIRDQEHSRVHCHELVTPFLLGHRDLSDDMVDIVSETDHNHRRLMQLLALEEEGREDEEIHSVLYQISELKIKLYLWHVKALNIFLTEITGETKHHSFLALKRGIKQLFSEWRLNLSDTTEFLKRARMFRPPCVVSHLPEGSTKRPEVLTITPVASTTLRNCEEDEEDCGAYECEIGDEECGKALRMNPVPILKSPTVEPKKKKRQR